jgi:drug/metabolite transporter (DMT)-like permease
LGSPAGPSPPRSTAAAPLPDASKPPVLPASSGARAAALRLLLSSALFALMAAGAKLCTRRLPGPEVALVRFVFGTVTVVAVAALGHARIRPRRWRWLALRGLGGGTAVVTYFAAIGRTPVGVATLLNQTQPVFTMLFSWLLLAERPRRGALGALSLTLGGVVVIVGVRELTLHAWRGEALGILSAILSGVAVTAIRASRRTTAGGTPPETAWSVFFSFTLLGSLVSTPWVFPPLGHWVTPTGAEWALLLGVGAVSVGAQVIMTEAIGHLTGVQSGIISQLTVPMTVALGLGFLGESLTASFAAGAALIVGGVVLTIATTARRRPSPSPSDPAAEDIVVS